MLQHGKGDVQRWTESHQQRGSGAFVSATRFYDTGRVGRISIRKEARPGASSFAAEILPATHLVVTPASKRSPTTAWSRFKAYLRAACCGDQGNQRCQLARNRRSSRKKMEARVGFEPTNGGFADLSLGPLGYRAELLSIANCRSPTFAAGHPLMAVSNYLRRKDRGNDSARSSQLLARGR